MTGPWGGEPRPYDDRKLRFVCFRRDRWTCQRCGYVSPRRDGRDLIADHIQNLARGGRKARLANLQTLCPPCHREKTRAEQLAGRRPSKQRPRPIHPADRAIRP